jgi:aprataxin
MNPMRPDYLKNDYTKGCKILHEAYISLFENFASVVQSYTGKQHNESVASKSTSGATTPSDSKMKRESIHDESERMKKHKLFQPILSSKQQHEGTRSNAPNYRGNSSGSSNAPNYTGNSSGSSDSPNHGTKGDHRKSDMVTSKSWGSWAQALYELAMHPDKYKNSDSILDISDEFVVLKDLHPKVPFPIDIPFTLRL